MRIALFAFLLVFSPCLCRSRGYIDNVYRVLRFQASQVKLSPGQKNPRKVVRQRAVENAVEKCGGSVLRPPLYAAEMSYLVRLPAVNPEECLA